MVARNIAFEEVLDPRTYEAGEDLSTKQYYAGYMDTDGKVRAIDATTRTFLGIILDKPAAAGRACRVVVDGSCPCIFGGSVTAGDRVTFNSSGQIVTVGSGDDVSIGTARTTNASGEIGTVELGMGLVAPAI